MGYAQRAVLRAILTLACLIPTALSAMAHPSTPALPSGLPRCAGLPAPVATPTASLPAILRTPGPAPSPGVRVVADVPLPGSASRFDYQSLDATTGHLVITHMGADQVVIFDTTTQQVVGTVEDIKTPTGVLAVPDLHRIFVAASGSHDVAVIDADTLKVITHVGQLGFPDGLAYAPASQQVFVSDESGGGELVIDATTNTVVTTIAIGGQAGNTHYDPGSGCILVTVQDHDQLAVIAPTADRLVAQYGLDPACQTPHGFLIDAPRRLAFVACADTATLLLIDLPTMAVRATYPVGDDPDVLAFDPAWRRLYVAAESGVVSIFDEQSGRLQPVGAYRAAHAHTIAVDPTTHVVYLPLENVDGKPVLRILATAATG
jgi:YVTN family beta-propeller protein